MIRLVAGAILISVTTASAEEATKRQREACGLFSEASEGLGAAIEKQRRAYAGPRFGSLASDLPGDAARAALSAQQAQEEADRALKVFQERVEDLNYRLKVRSRG